MSWR
jgi:hypothetical protein